MARLQYEFLISLVLFLSYALMLFYLPWPQYFMIEICFEELELDEGMKLAKLVLMNMDVRYCGSPIKPYMHSRILLRFKYI